VRFVFAVAVERVAAVGVLFVPVVVFGLVVVLRFAVGEAFARAVVVFFAEERDFVPVLFLAAGFLAVERFADEAFAVVRFAVDLLAVAFLAVDLFAAGRLAVDFLAVDFFAVDRLAVDFFAGDFLAVDFFAEARFVPPEDFFAPLFDLDAADFLVVAI
jgi:hypothetical protein